MTGLLKVVARVSREPVGLLEAQAAKKATAAYSVVRMVEYVVFACS